MLVLALPDRTCEGDGCGNRIPPGVTRRRNTDGKLLCPACTQGKPSGVFGAANDNAAPLARCIRCKSFTRRRHQDKPICGDCYNMLVVTGVEDRTHGEYTLGYGEHKGLDEDGVRHHVDAMHQGKFCGSLWWRAKDHVIESAFVHPGHQRKGVGTALWNYAKEIDPEIKHSPKDFRTPEGQKWIESLGATGMHGVYTLHSMEPDEDGKFLVNSHGGGTRMSLDEIKSMIERGITVNPPPAEKEAMQRQAIKHTFTHPRSGKTYTRTTDDNKRGADYTHISIKDGVDRWHTSEEAARRRGGEVFPISRPEEAPPNDAYSPAPPGATCTVRSATQGVCGKPAVKVMTGRSGEQFGECEEHHMPPKHAEREAAPDPCENYAPEPGNTYSCANCSWAIGAHSAKALGMPQTPTSVQDYIRKHKLSRQVVAHDSGDGFTIAHCPFCGSGMVVARGDGSAECVHCSQVFTVQVQPYFPGLPQTDPNVPLMGGDHPPPGVDPEPPADDVEEKPKQDSGSGSAENKSGNTMASRRYVASTGIALDRDAYLFRLALEHADDRNAVLASTKVAVTYRRGDEVAVRGHRDLEDGSYQVWSHSPGEPVYVKGSDGRQYRVDQTREIDPRYSVLGSYQDNCPVCGRRITDFDDNGTERDDGQRWCRDHFDEFERGHIDTSKMASEQGQSDREIRLRKRQERKDTGHMTCESCGKRMSEADQRKSLTLDRAPGTTGACSTCTGKTAGIMDYYDVVVHRHGDGAGAVEHETANLQEAIEVAKAHHTDKAVARVHVINRGNGSVFWANGHAQPGGRFTSVLAADKQWDLLGGDWQGAPRYRVHFATSRPEWEERLPAALNAYEKNGRKLLDEPHPCDSGEHTGPCTTVTVEGRDNANALHGISSSIGPPVSYEKLDASW